MCNCGDHRMMMPCYHDYWAALQRAPDLDHDIHHKDILYKAAKACNIALNHS